MRKTRFKVDAASCAFIAMRHIRNQKSGATDLCNNFVIDFFEHVLTIDSIRLESCCPYCRVYSLIVYLVSLLY